MSDDSSRRGGQWPEGDPRNDRVYMGILLALMATVFVAAGISIVGDMALDSPVLREGGFYVALVAGVAYFGFRMWGRVRATKIQQEKRRQELARDPDETDADN